MQRHYTKTKSGFGYSTQGYVYLTNEVTFALYFANCCNLEDGSDYLVLFKIDLQIEKVLPDYDEIRIQSAPKHVRDIYQNDLDYSLRELKTCRIDFDIDLRLYCVNFCKIDLLNGFNPCDVIRNAGRNYEYVTGNYTDLQTKFINNLKWDLVR